MEKELKEIFAANQDLEERIKDIKLEVTYDREFDIFMLEFGEPQDAITEEIRDGLQFRLDPDSLKILALEIRGFKRRFLKMHPDFISLCDLLFPEQGMVSRDIPPNGRQRVLAKKTVGALSIVLGSSPLALGSSPPTS